MVVNDLIKMEINHKENIKGLKVVNIFLTGPEVVSHMDVLTQEDICFEILVEWYPPEKPYGIVKYYEITVQVRL